MVPVTLIYPNHAPLAPGFISQIFDMVFPDGTDAANTPSADDPVVGRIQ